MADPARPERIWHNGALVPWGQAAVHVWTECATRGANVFEGIRAYWDDATGGHRIVALDRHLRRLADSATLMRLPLRHDTIARIRDGVIETVRHEARGRHAYLRPTIYLAEGRYATTAADATIGSYVVLLRLDAGAPGVPVESRLAVSSWRRIPEDSFPARIKTGAAYQQLRLATLDARDRGADDAILLDHAGRVTESAGAALAIVRDGRIVVPHTATGVLPSITREIVLEMLAAAGHPVVERPIGRSELVVADEVFLMGTLAGIVAVVGVDGHPIGTGRTGPVARLAARRYDAACRGGPDTPDWITVVDADLVEVP